MDMSEDDLQHVATILEARMHDAVQTRQQVKRSHWKRRTILVVVVLATGYATHYAIESGFAAAAQSFELVLASLIDSIYARVKE